MLARERTINPSVSETGATADITLTKNGDRKLKTAKTIQIYRYSEGTRGRGLQISGRLSNLADKSGYDGED
jgi:hypothetical protein